MYCRSSNPPSFPLAARILLQYIASAHLQCFSFQSNTVRTLEALHPVRTEQ
ncbi:hypothetical protein AB205_0046210 [Aquarana catesbeiana]|uniref:Uncharacterized protein n=1 Tax=Aquarana catesbeiana TaxID=8400 RepID=A0A2G9R5X2_AQUCT|nr:hypothetical protein AB205_0046210 [Aquarana catesbeiana]